jgi:type II secretory pathway pseudopilin PulG
MRSRKSNSGQSGYVLLVVMLAMTFILIAMSIAAPRIAQQIKRQKEEELVYRGKEYATAVKRFAHKSGGQYPATIEQLENTNHIRFLRQRYKDPMTGDSDWRMVHYGEAQVTIPAPNPGLNNSTQSPGLSGSSSGLTGTPTGATGSGTNAAGQPQGLTGGGSGLTPPPQAGGTGTLTTSGIGNGQPAGGGQIIGVASVNKGKSIKEFNDKDHYNDWLFVYDLRLEQNGGNGLTVAAPIAPGTAAAGQGNAAAGATGGQNPPANGQQPAPAGTNGAASPTPSPLPN